MSDITIDLSSITDPINQRLDSLEARIAKLEVKPDPKPDPVPDPIPDPKPDPVPTPTVKKPISLSDLIYEGCFRLPQSVCGSLTTFAMSSLAVDEDPKTGKRMLISSGHRNAGNPMYAARIPDTLAIGPKRTGPLPARDLNSLIKSDPNADWSGVPVATVDGELGTEFYGGKRTTPSGSVPGNLPDITHGFCYFRELDRLYVSFGNLYPAGGHAAIDPCLLAIDLTRDSNGDLNGYKVAGPWCSNPNSASRISSQQIRGTASRIPDWFANKLGGRNLGLGGGGYFSASNSFSQGPALAIAKHPMKDTDTLDTMTLLSYTHMGPKRAERPNNSQLGPIATKAQSDAWIASGKDPAVWVDASGNAGVSWDWPGLDPTAGPGYWMASDTIDGSWAWIDTPTKSGPIWFATMGLGTVLYRRANPYIYNEVTADGYDVYMYTADYNDLLKVGNGQMKPHEPKLTFGHFDVPFFFQSVKGATWYKDRLYVFCHWSYGNQVASYPTVAVFKIAE